MDALTTLWEKVQNLLKSGNLRFGKKNPNKHSVRFNAGDVTDVRFSKEGKAIENSRYEIKCRMPGQPMTGKDEDEPGFNLNETNNP